MWLALTACTMDTGRPPRLGPPEVTRPTDGPGPSLRGVQIDELIPLEQGRWAVFLDQQVEVWDGDSRAPLSVSARPHFSGGCIPAPPVPFVPLVTPDGRWWMHAEWDEPRPLLGAPGDPGFREDHARGARFTMAWTSGWATVTRSVPEAPWDTSHLPCERPDDLVWREDGERVACVVGRALVVYDRDGGEVARVLPGVAPSRSALHPTAPLVAVAARDHVEVVSWQEGIPGFRVPVKADHVAWTSDRRFLLAWSRTSLDVIRRDGTVLPSSGPRPRAPLPPPVREPTLPEQALTVPYVHEGPRGRLVQFDLTGGSVIEARGSLLYAHPLDGTGRIATHVRPPRHLRSLGIDAPLEVRPGVFVSTDDYRGIESWELGRTSPSCVMEYRGDLALVDRWVVAMDHRGGFDAMDPVTCETRSAPPVLVEPERPPFPPWSRPDGADPFWRCDGLEVRATHAHSDGEWLVAHDGVRWTVHHCGDRAVVDRFPAPFDPGEPAQVRPSGAFVQAAGDSVLLWDPATRARMVVFDDPAEAILDWAGRQLAVRAGDRLEVRDVAAWTGEPLGE